MTLGQLPALSVTPSNLTPSNLVSSNETLKTFDFAVANVTRRWSLGSTGDEVKTIQQRLKERGCYSGEISGTFDASTQQAVAAYNAAKFQIHSLLSYGDGSVDTFLFNELNSGLLMTMCPK